MRPLERADARVPGCRLCEAETAGGVVVDDRGLVAIVEVDAPGVVVAPLAHLDVLERVPDRAGTLLAAVRRVATAVEQAYGAPSAHVEPTTDFPGAGGHVCYRIVPAPNGTMSPIDGAPAVDADVLSAAVRVALAERRTTLPPG